jgi:hypothetical protein
MEKSEGFLMGLVNPEIVRLKSVGRVKDVELILNWDKPGVLVMISTIGEKLTEVN